MHCETTNKAIKNNSEIKNYQQQLDTNPIEKQQQEAVIIIDKTVKKQQHRKNENAPQLQQNKKNRIPLIRKRFQIIQN